MSVHYVYRVYDNSDQLIYVGCTLNLFGRLKAHEMNSWWAYQAARVTAKVYPDKWTGRAAEWEVIQAERPRWNLFGRGARDKWSAADYCDYITASLNLSEPMTPSRLKRLQGIARHYRNRFGHEIPITIPMEATA